MKTSENSLQKQYELSEEQYGFYHENGYLIVPALFSHSECDRIYQLFRERADEKFSAILNLDREIGELRKTMLDSRILSDSS